MFRRIGRLWLAILALAAIVLPAVLSMSVARAAVPAPGDDPFYAAPADLASHPNGAVLGARTIAPLGLPIPVDAWQLRYRTTDSEDNPQLNVTTVLVPPVPWTGPRPVLSYQVPENSLDTRCAPSFTLRGGRNTDMAAVAQDVPFIADALRRGWAVVVSDYEGPQSRLFDGVTSGRGVLDGIRAARSFSPAGIDAASPVGAWGYSAEPSPRCGPPNCVRNTHRTWGSSAPARAEFPPISRPWHELADGQAGALLILLGLARNEPESRPGRPAERPGTQCAAHRGHVGLRCGSGPEIPGHPHRRPRSVPNLPAHTAFRNAATPNELGGTAPDTPLYLYHSISDEKIPVAGYNALVDTYCAQGATLTATHSLFPGHIGAAAGEAFGGMNFLADRFAGAPQAPGCQVS